MVCCSLTAKVTPRLALDLVAANARLRAQYPSLPPKARFLARASAYGQRPTNSASAGAEDVDLCLLTSGTSAIQILDDHRLLAKKPCSLKLPFRWLCAAFNSPASVVERMIAFSSLKFFSVEHAEATHFRTPASYSIGLQCLSD